MSILTINGSTRKESKTAEFIDLIDTAFPDLSFEQVSLLDLPLFHPNVYESPIPHSITDFKRRIEESRAVMIVTPEYIHNIPAALKSALEWTTKTGEMAGKKTLAMTYTPYSPRGEKAIQSLLYSLTALEANVVASIDMYHDAVGDRKLTYESKKILAEAFKLI